MPSNQFGNLFRITTWGESHGKAIGVVIDGCPAGISITEEEINYELSLRRPGFSLYTSPRKEEDRAEIYSGVFEGRTTGAPISLIIPNQNTDSSPYEPLKNLLRPGHANFTYLEKYGIFDYRGGGRASARETATRVAAGAIAKKILKQQEIEIVAFVAQIGSICAYCDDNESLDTLKKATLESPIYCPDLEAAKEMMKLLVHVQKEGDSLGGIVEARATGLPVGLGDPIYEKIEANLAKAFLSIPASRGFEIGSGFSSVAMKGSEHNDLFEKNAEGKVITKTNHAGGVLGGITSGMPLIARCAFKPASSIKKPQETLDTDLQVQTMKLKENAKHDPCVAIRGAPVVEAMTALVLVDCLLMHRLSRADYLAEKK